jgi:hypothetical protein
MVPIPTVVWVEIAALLHGNEAAVVVGSPAAKSERCVFLDVVMIHLHSF